MRSYMAKSGQTGLYVMDREMALQAIRNGFKIYEDDVLVADKPEDVDALDFEPYRCITK